MYAFYDNVFLGCMSSQGLKSRVDHTVGHVCYICVKCPEGIVCSMSWLVDDLWCRCNVVNFESHISNVVGYFMCGVAGDTLICCSKGQLKNKHIDFAINESRMDRMCTGGYNCSPR